MSKIEGQELDEKPSPKHDVERDTPAAEIRGRGRFDVGSMLQKWTREAVIRKGSLCLRAFALTFSLFSFIIMACNNHGPGRQFRDYEEYRYVLGIALLSSLYTGLQCCKYVHQKYTGKESVASKTAALIDFIGDQLMTFLLLSSASSAIPMTDRIREGGDNIFTDSCAAAITMSLLAFFSLAISSIIAGYRLSTQSFT